MSEWLELTAGPLQLICNHQADSPLYVWPDVWSGDLEGHEKEWSYMTPKVLTETPCVIKQQKLLQHGGLGREGQEVFCSLSWGYGTVGAQPNAGALGKKATIHEVTTMLSTSKNVLFPGHNHLLTTGTGDLTF